MKVYKILTDLLKRVEKKQTNAIHYAELDGYVYYTPDGNRMFKIPSHLFLIDMTRALGSKLPLRDPEKFFKPGDVSPAVRSNDVKLIPIKGGKPEPVIKFVGNNAHCWVREKYLKEFDADCKFYITDNKQPLYIVENGEYVVMILPVRIKEDLEND